MALPQPEPGLVVPFNYLWRREHEKGAEHGRYPRPCAIVLAVRRAPEAAPLVTVVPFTTKPRRPDQPSLQLPAPVKRHLGLEPQIETWVILDEVNEFVWPGFDLEPDSHGRLTYGFIPPKLYERIRIGMLEVLKTKRLSRVPR